MPNDDDDQGRKKNTERDHKPQDAERKGYAPRGSVGRAPAAMSGPGLGTSTVGRQGVQETQERSQRLEPAKDNRPLADKTGDKEVDVHYGKDHRLVSAQERKDMVSRSQEPEKSQSAGKGGMSAQDIFNKMAKDRSQERDRGR